PRLRVGAGPVSTTAADVTGDGIPDLLVSNSQSSNVSLLPGVGGGFFDDQRARTFTTGSDPRQVLVGDFTGDGRLDLVSVNAGANDLTFFRDFGQGISIASGGETPVAALASDFNGDGTSDLLVANEGDGQVTLFLGEAAGPTLAEAFSRPDVPHPTDLALLATGPELHVYAAEEAEETPFLLTSFGIPVPALGVSEPPPLANIFLLNGPGFTTELDLVAPPGPAPSRPSGNEGELLQPVPE